MKNVLAIFPSEMLVNNSLGALYQYGYQEKDISVIMKESVQDNDIGNKGGLSTTDFTSSVISGGIVGSLTGVLIGVGALIVPGLGALLIAGPLASAFGLTGIAALTISGAATGLLAGGLVGALIELGISKSDADFLESQIKEGKILLAVPISENISSSDVEKLLKANGAEFVKTVDSEKLIN